MWRLQCVVESAEFGQSHRREDRLRAMFRARGDLAGEDEDTKIVGRWEHMQVPSWRTAEGGDSSGPSDVQNLDPRVQGVARKEKPLTVSHL